MQTWSVAIMTNIKNRNAVAIHYTVDVQTKEIIDRICETGRQKFDKRIYKWQIIDSAFKYLQHTKDIDEFLTEYIVAGEK